MIRSAAAGGDALKTNLTGFFNSSVTILRAANTADEYGEQISTWAVLPDHCDLSALVGGGDVSIRLKKQEFRTAQAVYEVEYRRVLLAGKYTKIDHGDRARFDDRDWAIVSIVIDYTGTFTELLCESVEPGDV